MPGLLIRREHAELSLCGRKFVIGRLEPGGAVPRGVRGPSGIGKTLETGNVSWRSSVHPPARAQSRPCGACCPAIGGSARPGYRPVAGNAGFVIQQVRTGIVGTLHGFKAVRHADAALSPAMAGPPGCS